MEARYLTLTLAGEEQRSWRSVHALHLGPNHLHLSKVLLSFYQIFYSWFQISCVVRNNYVNFGREETNENGRQIDGK